MERYDAWGHLAARYETARPRRILTLDGGGIRGILTLHVLAEIEKQLAAMSANPEAFRLCDFFDYIAGTSTGAIIAAGLARGMSTEELIAFYMAIGPQMFQKDLLLRRLQHIYKADPLAAQLKGAFGVDTCLYPEDLKCLLLMVTRNVTTDSPWPITSMPDAKYNERARPDCNLQIPLWRLVRASTAAPIFFPPEIIEWEAGNPQKSFVFVDGGMTPYNNPSFLCFRMATAPEYRLGWKTGEDRLMIVSVGTGASVSLGPDAFAAEANIATTAFGIPGALMSAASVDQDISCRTVGRCVYGAVIDRELGDMVPRDAIGPLSLETNLGRAFVYARYNADLSREGLTKLGLPDVDPRAVQKLDAVDAIGDLARVGEAAARAVDLVAQFGALAQF
jgi:hypothetical protein